MPIQIIEINSSEKNLQEKYITQIAAWYFENWGKLANKSAEQFADEIKLAISESEAHHFIAIDTANQEAVGCLSLKNKNMEDEYPHASWGPWFSGLFVKENYRGKKIAALLGEHVAAKAIELNIKDIYYFSHNIELLSFYKKLGGAPVMPLIGDSYFYHQKPIILFSAKPTIILENIQKYLQKNLLEEKNPNQNHGLSLVR